MTTSCLSLLPGVVPHLGHVRMSPVTWSYAVVFVGYSSFLHQLQYSLAVICQKNEITNYKYLVSVYSTVDMVNLPCPKFVDLSFPEFAES